MIYSQVLETVRIGFMVSPIRIVDGRRVRFLPRSGLTVDNKNNVYICKYIHMTDVLTERCFSVEPS